MDDGIELLVTAVLVADNERTARDACEELLWRIDGRIVEATDCSAEEPGCWAVTMSVPTPERVAAEQIAAPLARAVRQFVRSIAPAAVGPRVACEPPTAWTVLDDPELVSELVPGAERLMVEAWWGGNPYMAPEVDQPANQLEERPILADVPVPPPEPGSVWTPPPPDFRLKLRVDVVAERAAGAEWQARAVASRISRSAELLSCTEREGTFHLDIDLGPTVTPPPQTVLVAVSTLERPGWSPLRWDGTTAISDWIATPRPTSGIIALQLSCGPDPARSHP